MSVFITGAGGFVGSHLAERVTSMGEEVTCLVNKDDKNCWIDTSKFRCVSGDIRNQNRMTNLIQNHDKVYHLAALLPSVSYSLDQYHDVNVLGTKNVLDAALKTGVNKIVYTSSRLSIDERGSKRVDEEHRHQGFFNNEYSLTKYKGEKLLFEYATRGIEATAVNPTLIYGPRETEQLTPLILKYLSSPIGVRGFESSIFNFVYVDDVVTGLIKAMRVGASGERYILSGQEYTIGEFLDLIEEVAGKNKHKVVIPNRLVKLGVKISAPICELINIEPPISKDQLQSMQAPILLDGSKAQEELSIDPTPIKQGIERTIEWYSTENFL